MDSSHFRNIRLLWFKTGVFDGLIFLQSIVQVPIVSFSRNIHFRVRLLAFECFSNPLVESSKRKKKLLSRCQSILHHSRPQEYGEIPIESSCEIFSEVSMQKQGMEYMNAHSSITCLRSEYRLHFRIDWMVEVYHRRIVFVNFSQEWRMDHG